MAVANRAQFARVVQPNRLVEVSTVGVLLADYVVPYPAQQDANKVRGKEKKRKGDHEDNITTQFIQ